MQSSIRIKLNRNAFRLAAQNGRGSAHDPLHAKTQALADREHPDEPTEGHGKDVSSPGAGEVSGPRTASRRTDGMRCRLRLSLRLVRGSRRRDAEGYIGAPAAGQRPAVDTELQTQNRPGTPSLNKKAERKGCFGLITRFDSGRHIKRSVKSSCCSLCGDEKYTPPASAKLACSTNPRLRCPGLLKRQGVARVRPAAQAQQKARLVIWLRKYPKVKLCDVAQVFGVISRDFSCTLPVLPHQKEERKKVPCFKQEYRSLMHICPGGNGKRIASQVCKVHAATNSCASLSSGEQVSEATAGEQVSDIAVGHEGFARTSECHDLRFLDREKMKTTSGKETAGNRAESSTVDTTAQKDTSVTRVPPLVLRRVPGCSGFDSPQRFLCELVADHKAPAAHHSPLEENGEDSEGDASSPLSFSCQRTQGYTGCPRVSCARTCRPWSFPRHGPPSEMKASVRAGPRWITGTDPVATEPAKSTNTECTPGQNFRESQVKKTLKVTFAMQCEVEPDPSEVCKTLKDPAEHQKNPNKAAELDLNMAKPGYHSITDPEPSAGKEPACFLQDKAPCTVENHTSKAGENSPKSSSGQRNLLGSLKDSPKIKTGEVRGHDQRLSHSSCKTVEGSKDMIPCTVLDNFENMSAKPKTHPITRRPVEETQTAPSCSSSCKAVHFKAEHQASSSVIEHRKAEQSPNPVVDNRLIPLCSKTTAPASSPPDSTTGRRLKRRINSLANKDDSSSSSAGEDMKALPSSDDPQDTDAESQLQENTCKVHKANQSSSPLHSPQCSVVVGSELDVLRAYEEDAIILDVIQDDPDLFGAVNMESAESHTRPPCPDGGKRKPACLQPEESALRNHRHKIVWDLEPKSSRPARAAGVRADNPEDSCAAEISGNAQDSVAQLYRRCTPFNRMSKPEETVTDFNNNLDKSCTDEYFNSMATRTGSSRLLVDPCSSAHATAGTGVPRSLPVSLSKQPVEYNSGCENMKHKELQQYCWYYFSEYHTCKRIVCWFLHLPRNEDETFCMEAVQRFSCAGAPLLQRAVDVFVGYYTSNSPGASFNQNVVNSLLSSLLNVGMLKDLISAINTLLTHKKTPPPELVMALYEHVTERGLLTSASELILLTSKIIEAGCVFTVSQCELMQSQLQMLQVPRQQMDIFHAAKCRAVATNPHTVDVLAQAMVQVEMYKQQGNWAGLASVFCSVCAGPYTAGEVSRFCCCVTMALQKETKDKLAVPYELFAESVCQELPSDGLVNSFLGRVGVSLMLLYHRIRDWTKGVKMVHIMSRLNLEFSKLKGLLATEDGTSRCQLITLAVEISLNSGSIEGALHVLREEDWFVSSSTWPCEQADVENRRRVLTLLAGKTSHRDALVVLSNLPGITQPLDGIQVGEYCNVFNAHLQKSTMNQALLVAADTLEFMLTHRITADVPLLQNLIHRLGKQNVWSRARALFKRAHSGGFYSEVVHEQDSLAVPCSLSEIELTLAFEMFITSVKTSLQNPIESSHPLLITLKRNSGGGAAEETEYLAAGCRMLSAAQIPNPKLSIRYVAVSRNQEQFFHLDRNSASKWLSHNHPWAQELWAN